MIYRPHGESNIVLTCQNKCVGCNHFIPIQKPWLIDPIYFRVDLFKAAKLVHFDRYNLVGGEPTLHPKILELIQIIKDSEIADSIEITTNGQLYKSWPDELYQAIDELIVTPYKLSNEDLQAIGDKCRQYGTSFQVHPVIFTECAYKEKASDEIAHARYKNCWYNVNRHVIDGGVFYRCCTSPFIPCLLLNLDNAHDGISLDGLTEDALRDYLNQEETPASCYVCASNCGSQIPWRETSNDKWLEESVK